MFWLWAPSMGDFSSWLGIELAPHALEGNVSTTRPPGNVLPVPSQNVNVSLFIHQSTRNVGDSLIPASFHFEGYTGKNKRNFYLIILDSQNNSLDDVGSSCLKTHKNTHSVFPFLQSLPFLPCGSQWQVRALPPLNSPFRKPSLFHSREWDGFLDTKSLPFSFVSFLHSFSVSRDWLQNSEYGDVRSFYWAPT